MSVAAPHPVPSLQQGARERKYLGISQSPAPLLTSQTLHRACATHTCAAIAHSSPSAKMFGRPRLSLRRLPPTSIVCARGPLAAWCLARDVACPYLDGTWI